ncbi:unnamed protein product, partial [Heterotrigona itama]
WEYPIQKSKNYWETFCDDEEKRLVVVRNPSLQLSYRFLSKNNTDFIDFNPDCQNKVSNWSCFSNSCSDHKAPDNSLHRLLPIFKSSKDLGSDDAKSFPKPILKGSSQAGLKSSDTTGYLATSSKVVRIPKLDTHPQPSSRKIQPQKEDHIRTSCSVENEPEIQEESFPSLPILDTYPTMSELQLKLKKFRDIQKHLRLSDGKDSKTNGRSWLKIAQAKNKTDRSQLSRIKKENEKTLTDEDSLMYSARFAYKALKRLTKNKTLDFKFKPFDNLQEEPVFKSVEDYSFASDDGKQEFPEIKRIEKSKRNEKPLNVHDLQMISEEKSLEDSEFTHTDVKCPSLKSDDSISRTIPTESRYTSGLSPVFVYPEDWKSPSTRVLSSIPKLSGFPRKNRDRCLPCMYKSFETPLKRKVSLPKTTLQRIIAESSGLTSPENSLEDSDSTSASIPNFEDEVERTLTDEVETNDVRLESDVGFVESDVFENELAVAGAAALLEEERIQKQLTSEVEQKSISKPEPSFNVITKKGKEDRRDDDTTTTNLNEDTTSLTRVTSLERTKVRPSSRSVSSEEDDSIVVSVSDDQPKPKYLVPCHAPTNFRPSLEPLRALRNRKPTTLQDRIAFLESATSRKSSSADNYGDIPENPRVASKGVLEKDKIGDEKKSVPPPLTKAKSVVEKLMHGKAEAGTEKQRHVLRKEISFSSFSVSTDTASNSSEIYRDASKDALRELDATRDDGLLKMLFAADFPRTRGKLPLTQPCEIAEILKDLGQNVSSTGMLEILCKEFSERLINRVEHDDSSASDRNKTIANLTRLLVDSKRYLHSDKFPSDLVFSTDQPPTYNSQLLRRVLPLKTYNRVAPLLGMPEYYPKRKMAIFEDLPVKADKIGRTQIIDETSMQDSLEVHPPTLRDTESPVDQEKLGRRRYNPYALFLMKPRRKVVTWRPLTKRDLEGYDPEATLKMRADNSMKRICQDFCQWVETLGGTDNTIDEEVLRDMFEIDFSADACRAMQMSIQEMPVVAAEVAVTRNTPGASKLAMTKKHVMKDAKAEVTPAKIKAFGTGVPRKLRFVPPNNQVQKKWLQCENVPKDIETMEVVWKDILDLRSVRGFVEWLQQHPEIPQPEALEKIASMDIKTLRQIEDDETFAHLELDINQIKSLRVLINGGDVSM